MIGLREYLEQFSHLSNFRIIADELVFTWLGEDILFWIAIEQGEYVVYTNGTPQKRASEALEIIEFFSLIG